MKSFENLGLSPETLKVLELKGFETPTPIQEKTIPAMLTGTKDIVGQAQTGTGKTAAFGLPIIELIQRKAKTVQVLVLTPTRELAIQVAEEIYSLKGKKELTIVPIYGGQSMELQLRSLRKGVDIVVGTPGRILDHLHRRTLRLDAISFLVLDEADEMLNMGFFEDVSEIMKSTNPAKRTLLFSATMPQEIMDIAKKYMKEHEIFKVTKGQLTVSQTDQIYFEVSEANKFEALCRIIDIEEEFFGLVFCRTKIDVDTVAAHLMERGYDADALHGDMAQNVREKILNKFKKQLVNVLVATDVAARGIDVQDLTHVINYSLPHDPQSYVHRVGRTGRAGKTGNAITFITPQEYRKLQYISRVAKTDIRRARLPRIDEVIKSKKLRIKSRLEEIIKSGPQPEFIEMAEDLLKDNEAQDVICALLQCSFGGELDEKSYSQIKDSGVDNKGKTRLFVSQGKQDGLTNKKLTQIIRDKCNVREEKIRDVQILERFSFVSLPFHEAEMVLSYFRGRKKDSSLVIEKAKESRSKK
ncbi:MAG: DEAD/DEAH box helicase [Candidatus Omnitrophica bacterium]|nr:DEAD/DEAH box helicase [Candidatus Omnitrophota bacterium]